MADNAQKQWMQKNLGNYVNNKTGAADQQTPKTMPCTVVSVEKSMVTVKFETQGNFTLPQMTIPVAMSDYARIPTQKGDKGYAVPNDFYMGGQSGQGGGTANYIRRGNLSTLCFHHVSNTDFSDVDYNAYTIQGPNGVVLQSKDKSTTFTLTPGGNIHIKGNLIIEGSITTTGGGGSMTASGDIATTGGITAGAGGADSVTLQHHTHAGGPAPTPGT